MEPSVGGHPSPRRGRGPGDASGGGAVPAPRVSSASAPPKLLSLLPLLLLLLSACPPPPTLAAAAVAAAAPSAAAMASAASSSGRVSASVCRRIAALPEGGWRSAASAHSDRVRSLLGPGLTDPSHRLNSGTMRRDRRRGRSAGGMGSGTSTPGWTALDPENPVYNFLIEYYGLKGAKGPRRLARWSPDPSLALAGPAGPAPDRTAGAGPPDGARPPPPPPGDEPAAARAAIESARRIAGGAAGGVLLLGATEDDLSGTLHLRGATIVPPDGEGGGSGGGGVLYSPALTYNRFGTGAAEGGGDDERGAKMRAASPFLWYRSVLAGTLESDPVLHCHGLHEWAMQYRPPGAPPPPSAKYQRHLPLRVPQTVINGAVERRGVHCTHVDALRYFAPAAAALNHRGPRLERADQPRLEQPGCVHAHMDLLKMAARLGPFVDAALVGDALEVALEARRLDVEASPYDVTSYGLRAVPVETASGRAEYRRRQAELMEMANPVRRKVLGAYEIFLSAAFDEDIVGRAERSPDPERFAVAAPGGAPWRRSLIERGGGDR